LLSEVIATSIAPTCPGLFCPTPAQDGILSRIRVPGGILNGQQCEAIATLSNQFCNGFIQITNRANLQLRGLQAGLPTEALQRLQVVGLAALIPAVDAIRNIMSSPTAGIDARALLDTRPLVRDWNNTLMSRPDLAILSPKFSVCFDGGECASVGDRPNDITLVAFEQEGSTRFRLSLSMGERGDAPQDTGVSVKMTEAIALLTALAEVYRDYICQNSDRSLKPPRLRDLLKDWGIKRYLNAVTVNTGFSLISETADLPRSPSLPYAHLGVHPQQQTGLTYIGVSLPLGQLQTQQLQGLASLSAQYGDGTLRLAPWQTVIVPNIFTSQIVQIQQQIKDLNLHTNATHPSSAMVACSGTTGCKAAMTDTQHHAQIMTAYLERCIALDTPINIHFSGCEKSCAQHQSGDITLVGAERQGAEAYQVYVGNDGSKFGRALYHLRDADALPQQIESMIRAYQQHRQSVQESFTDFVNRHAIAELQQLFDTALRQS
jgi:ferredoxin-nitrite reductase